MPQTLLKVVIEKCLAHISCDEASSYDVLEICRERIMAERKSALKRAPKRPNLEALIRRAQENEVSDDVLQAQRASFVYGNAPKGSRITRETAAASTGRIRVTS